MDTRLRRSLGMAVAFTLLMYILASCGSSSGPSLEDIPRYPNAIEGESMQQSGFGGAMGGSLVQFTTTDPFDEVVDFYTEALNQYDIKVASHTSELGRQTAISIPQKNGIISVAIQDFTEEGQVSITFMGVGS